MDHDSLEQNTPPLYMPSTIERTIHEVINNKMTQKNASFNAAYEFTNTLGKDVRVIWAVNGVGTKIIVAKMMGVFDSVGYDVVALNVNDVLCSGIKPLIFSDYLACHEKITKETVDSIENGIIKACKEGGIEAISGETPIISEMLAEHSDPGRTFELAGFAMGITSGNPINGSKMKEGDIVVGLASSGLHANGYTLARPTLLKFYKGIGPYDLDSGFDGSKLGDILLRPTKMYVNEIMHSLKDKEEDIEISGLGHITGGGFSKLLRLCRFSDKGIILNNMPEPPALMKEIKHLGGISDYEMYRTFNMGIGFVTIMPQQSVENFITICEQYGTKAQQIGMVSSAKGKQVTIRNGNDEIKYDSE